MRFFRPLIALLYLLSFRGMTCMMAQEEQMDGTTLESLGAEEIPFVDEPHFHENGSCHLWWPLNRTNVFYHSRPRNEEDVMYLRQQVILTCSALRLEETFEFLVDQQQLFLHVSSMDMDDETRTEGNGDNDNDDDQVVPLRPHWNFKEPLVVSYYIQARVERLSVKEKIRFAVFTRNKYCVSEFYIDVFHIVGTDPYWKTHANLQAFGFNGNEVSEMKIDAPHPLINQIHNRQDLGVAIPMLVPNASSFAEIGVYKGEFAEHMLQTWPGCKRYLLIDLWNPQPWENYIDYVNDQDVGAHNVVLQEVQKRMEPFKDIVVFMRMSSVQASLNVEVESLDVVYIDAAHDYMAVKQDICAWYPKVKMGGMLAGHDYDFGYTHNTLFTVKPAVDEFALTMRFVVYQTRDSSFPTWFLFKPHRSLKAQELEKKHLYYYCTHNVGSL
jgi:hypothetical protein